MVFSEQAATWRHVTFRTTWMLALLIIALQGCVILPIPTPEHGLLSGRGEITEADAASLEVGKTTREEVLLHLGEPSAILYDEQILIYQWSVVRCYLIWAVYGGAGDVSPIPKDYLLLLQFDVHGRLKRFDRTSPGLFESMAERVDKWTPPGSIKLADVERAADPRISETRGRFVINPVPNAESQPDSALAGVPSLRLKIEDFRDERAAGKAKLIGRKSCLRGCDT